MPLRKYYRLTTATLCIETVNGRKQAREVPQGEIVKVLSGPRPDDQRMIDVLWGSKRLALFAEDLQARGEEVHQMHATA